MKRQPARITAVWFAAIVQLVASVGFAAEITLCVADDGHIALEAPHPPGPCLTDYHRHHPRASHLEAIDFEHHGCTDTLLSQPPAVRDRAMTGAPARPTRIVAGIPAPCAPLVSRHACAERGRVTCPPARDLATRRTIVLVL
jgi:hypothetical protein